MKMGDKLSKFFEEYLNKEPLFINKKILQSGYTPNNIPHRDEQIKQLAKVLAPALRMEKPSNVFIYGKTGSGKTCVSQYVVNEIYETCKKNKLNVNIYYLNCKMKKVADTEYRLVAELARGFGAEVPATGLPTEEVYKIFINTIESKKQLLILILDEIDQLVKKMGDGILYNLTRLNSELKNCEMAFVGISNDLTFTENLDPRVKSSLSEEELVFPPYNAIEHGDARRALELLRVAGELSERDNAPKLSIKYIDEAENKIERDRVLDIIKTQPKQQQLTTYSILEFYNTGKN